MPPLRAYLGQPDINAFNVMLLTDTHMAIICIRTGRGISPGNAQLLPLSILQLLAPSSNSEESAIEVMCPIQGSERRDRYEGEVRGRPLEKKLRPSYVRCPPPLAAGVVASALALTPPDVSNQPEVAEVLMFFRAHVPHSDPEALPKFVEAYARSATGVLIGRLVADMNPMMVMYLLLDKRGEYFDLWSFYEPISQLWSKKYLPTNAADASNEHRLKTALSALCSDSKELARHTVRKCDLMCEYMAAWHLLAQQKALASFMLGARDYIRQNGLKDSYFGRAMMIRSTAGIPDAATKASFLAIAQDFNHRDEGETYAIFTMMSNEEVLNAAKMVLDSGALHSPVYTPPMSKEEEEEVEQKLQQLTIAEGSSWIEEEREEVLRHACEQGLKGVSVSCHRLSDLADLDREVGYYETNGMWSTRLGTSLSNRKAISSDDVIDLGVTQLRRLIRQWIDNGPQTLDGLFEHAQEDAEVALKLADSLMTGAYGEGEGEERRDPMLACKWYYHAATMGNLEAMIAVGHLCESKLLGTEWEGTRRTFQASDADSPVFHQMIYWFGLAAKHGHVAPLTLRVATEACGPCKLASSSLEGADHVLRALLQNDKQVQTSLLRRLNRLRSLNVSEAVEQANASRARGNEALRAGDAASAVSAYDEAISTLAGFDSVVAAAWPLALCFSNRAQARLKMVMHEDASNDCACAAILLDRYESQFAADDVKALRAKLSARERAASKQAAEAQQAAESESAQAAAALRSAEEIAARQQERLRQAQARAEREREERQRQREAEARAAEARERTEGQGSGAHEAANGRERAVEEAEAQQSGAQEAAERPVEDAVTEERRAREAAEECQRAVEEAEERQRRAQANQEAHERARERRERLREERRRRRQQARARTETDALPAAARGAEETDSMWAERLQREEADRRAQQEREAAEAEDLAHARFLSRQSHAQERRRRREEQRSGRSSSSSTPLGTPAAAPSSPATRSNSANDFEIDPDYECPICIEGIEKGCFYPFCGKHPIHLLCMEEWRQESVRKREVLTCPMCREPIYM